MRKLLPWLFGAVGAVSPIPLLFFMLWLVRNDESEYAGLGALLGWIYFSTISVLAFGTLAAMTSRPTSSEGWNQRGGVLVVLAMASAAAGIFTIVNLSLAAGLILLLPGALAAWAWVQSPKRT